MSKKVLIVGTGSVGSLYGLKLQQAGWDVSATVRSDYDHIKQLGISIKSIWGDDIFRPTQVCKTPSEYSGKADYIIVCTKVIPELNIAEFIRPAVTPTSIIVLLQNGINIEEKVAKEFPNNELISGLAFVCINKIKPGEVLHQDFGRLVLGVYPTGSSSGCQVLGDAFKKSGVHVKLTDKILKARWKKLIWNAPFNPLSVIEGCTTLDLLSCPEMEIWIRDIMKEVCELAKKDGYELEDDVIDRNILDTKKMTPFKTSMWTDYKEGKQLEIDAILTNALQLAETYNLDTPNLKALKTLLIFKTQYRKSNFS